MPDCWPQLVPCHCQLTSCGLIVGVGTACIAASTRFCWNISWNTFADSQNVKYICFAMPLNLIELSIKEIVAIFDWPTALTQFHTNVSVFSPLLRSNARPPCHSNIKSRFVQHRISTALQSPLKNNFIATDVLPHLRSSPLLSGGEEFKTVCICAAFQRWCFDTTCG